MATVGFKLSILENGTLSSVAIGFSRVFINVTRAKCAWAGTTQLPNARQMILALKKPFGSDFFFTNFLPLSLCPYVTYSYYYLPH